MSQDNLSTAGGRSTVQRLLRSRFVTFWLPWIITVITGVISIWQYVGNTADYKISMWTERSREILAGSADYPVELLVDGHLVTYPGDKYVSTLTLWNSGKKTIAASDFRSPFAIEFSCTIFAGKIVGQNTLGTDSASATFVPNSENPTQIILNLAEFDPGEAVKIAFVSGCFNQEYKMKIESPIVNQVEQYFPWTTLGVGFILFAYMTANLTIFDYVQSAIARRAGRAWGMLFRAIGIASVIAAAYYFVTGTRLLLGVPLIGAGPL